MKFFLIILFFFSSITKSCFVSIKLILVFWIFILTSVSIFTQNKTIYPYGGEIDLSRKMSYKLAPLNFKSSFSFKGDHFIRIADFTGAHFYNSVYFEKATFDSLANFSKTKFTNDAYFNYTKFINNFDIHYTHFIDTSDFFMAHFYKNANFSSTNFDEKVNFYGTKFDGYVNFSSSKFKGITDFRFAIFNFGLFFREATFKEKLVLVGTFIRGELDLRGTEFLNGMDFRLTNLDSLNKIYIDHNTSFPEGKFWVRWGQIKDRLSLYLNKKDSISIFSSGQNLNKSSVDSLKQKHYRNIEIFYHKLRENYIAQRDNASADNVMYELAVHRANILQEFHWKLYGWFIGWGYQPWKFLLFIVLPLILIFSFIWYLFYFELVIRMVDDKIEKEFSSNLNKPNMTIKEVHLLPLGKNFSNSITLKVYDHSDSTFGLSRLSRYWHMLFFSVSVLLDIRFKKEWLQKIESKNRLGEKTFLPMITFEWILGIGLYVGFALLVSSSRFDFIKEILGF